MSEKKTPLIRLEEGKEYVGGEEDYVITGDHTVSDVIRHLLYERSSAYELIHLIEAEAKESASNQKALIKNHLEKGMVVEDEDKIRYVVDEIKSTGVHCIVTPEERDVVHVFHDDELESLRLASPLTMDKCGSQYCVRGAVVVSIVTVARESGEVGLVSGDDYVVISETSGSHLRVCHPEDGLIEMPKSYLVGWIPG